jgi:hypothetical protein
MRFVAKLTHRNFANVTYGYGADQRAAVQNAHDNLGVDAPFDTIVSLYSESEQGEVKSVWLGALCHFKGEQ